MAYLSDDELLDTEGGFTVWDDGTGTGVAEETLEQALAEERLAELESELEQDEHPVDYDAELEWQSWKASWSRTSIPSIMVPNWKPRKKKPPRSAKSG